MRHIRSGVNSYISLTSHGSLLTGPTVSLSFEMTLLVNLLEFYTPCRIPLLNSSHYNIPPKRESFYINPLVYYIVFLSLTSTVLHLKSGYSPLFCSSG